ncbi:MAG TPA: hypothetical protein VIW07_01640, partial [Candidatus Udaeobacter sp.]
DRPVVVAAAMEAAAVDTVVVAKVASAGATRNSLVPTGFCSHGKVRPPWQAPPYALVIVLKRDAAATQRHQHFDEGLGRAGFEPAKA